MWRYGDIHNTLGSEGYERISYYLVVFCAYYLNEDFWIVNDGYFGPRTCSSCEVPIPEGHMVLVNRADVSDVRCWECLEQAFLVEKPDVVPPPELDQFRDTGRR